MIIEKGKQFNSKILLFGEYTLMEGSKALSIPYDKFHGQLQFEKRGKKSAHYSVQYLKEYLNFLNQNNFEKFIDIANFRDDLSDGLIFETNIPISYGLGSSGAIVASIYDSYANSKSNNYKELKHLFASMESFYHGKSSGLDPLVSYTNKTILVHSDENIKSLSLPSSNKGGTIFILDTLNSGETQPLVNWFLKEMNNYYFSEQIRDVLTPLNDEIISHLIAGSLVPNMKLLKSLSQFTYDRLHKMIPEKIKGIWESGLSSDSYYLKLCGSGGGGMMLGVTTNYDEVKNILKNYNLHMVMHF
ncbi:MAG: mevalonate kinase [Bacteroidetes bacterium]|jgi:mevalonate kinase|nr:mevalonate kinase [Bacteroidota bacterium]